MREAQLTSGRAKKRARLAGSADADADEEKHNNLGTAIFAVSLNATPTKDIVGTRLSGVFRLAILQKRGMCLSTGYDASSEANEAYSRSVKSYAFPSLWL